VVVGAGYVGVPLAATFAEGACVCRGAWAHSHYRAKLRPAAG
jgi:UDP-N-acetyl-D-mannosaminuronate dehydrogenase